MAAFQVWEHEPDILPEPPVAKILFFMPIQVSPQDCDQLRFQDDGNHVPAGCGGAGDDHVNYLFGTFYG